MDFIGKVKNFVSILGGPFWTQTIRHPSLSLIQIKNKGER